MSVLLVLTCDVSKAASLDSQGSAGVHIPPEGCTSLTRAAGGQVCLLHEQPRQASVELECMRLIGELDTSLQYGCHLCSPRKEDSPVRADPVPLPNMSPAHPVPREFFSPGLPSRFLLGLDESLYESLLHACCSCGLAIALS